MEVSRTDEFQYIDDTGLSCNVDIEVAANMTNAPDRRDALRKAGFEVGQSGKGNDRRGVEKAYFDCIKIKMNKSFYHVIGRDSDSKASI